MGFHGRYALGASIFFVLLWASFPCAARSQVPADADSARAEPRAIVAESRHRGGWWTLWSRKTPHDRLIVGMITSHVYDLDDGPKNNYALGLIRAGVVGATFVTTHGRRGWVAAAERSWFEGTLGPARTMLGFRAGLLYGYDERLFALAEWTPVIPYGQPVFLVRAGPLSFDLAYTWVVVSLTVGASL